MVKQWASSIWFKYNQVCVQEPKCLAGLKSEWIMGCWWWNICATGQMTKMDICQSSVDKYCVTRILFSKRKQFRKRSIWCRSDAALKSSSSAVLFVVKYLAISFLTRERRNSGSMSLSSAHVLKPVFGGRALGSENWGKKEGNCWRKVEKYSCIQMSVVRTNETQICARFGDRSTVLAAD